MTDEVIELDMSSSTIATRKRTAALFSDALRFRIIQEIKERPLLWDTRIPREPLSLLQRKQEYINLANILSSTSTPLSSIDIEKQWKNLKDTFYKVKRKYLETAPQSDDGSPRWRFYGALNFLEDIEIDSKALSPGVSGLIEPKNFATDTDSGEEQLQRKRRKIALTPNSIQASSSSTNVYKKTSATTKPATESGLSFNNAHSSFYVEDDDKYSHYGQYLARQLREIGNTKSTEFFKLQKIINDAVSDSLIRLHESSANTPASNSSQNHS